MIRQATTEDLEQIMQIYAYARSFMAANGNPTQWGDSYPPRQMIEDDIKKGELYVLAENDRVQAVFLFFVGTDETYLKIENGSWLSDAPYGVIHRVAAGAGVHGVVGKVVAYCFEQIPHLRMDTHADNKVMQRRLEKNGFEKCGIIYVRDGSPRIAYEKR